MIHDISAPLSESLVTWPGVVERFERSVVNSFELGDDMVVSAFRIGAHAGTHVDAPSHFLPDGGGLETIPVSSFIGDAWVADISHDTDVIGSADLESAGIPDQFSRILLKTSNSGWSTSGGPFDESFVACDRSAAEWLVERGAVLVGIDYLSIEPFRADTVGYPAHKLLLGNGVVVLESLDLAGVEPGPYRLIALPLRVPGSDAAPARAVLISEQET